MSPQFEIRYAVPYEKGGSNRGHTICLSQEEALSKAEELCGRFRHVCIYSPDRTAPIVIMHHGRPVWNPTYLT